jgi:hypothetical protein
MGSMLSSSFLALILPLTCANKQLCRLRMLVDGAEAIPRERGLAPLFSVRHYVKFPIVGPLGYTGVTLNSNNVLDMAD